jgi:hypothetical protein
VVRFFIAGKAGDLLLLPTPNRPSGRFSRSAFARKLDFIRQDFSKKQIAFMISPSTAPGTKPSLTDSGIADLRGFSFFAQQSSD